MTAAQGLDLLDRLLAARPMPGQVVVSTRDLATVRRLAAAIDPARLAAELAETPTFTTVYPRPDLENPYEAPDGEAETAIAAIWQEALGVDRIGRYDDFFALGGHSLAAVQIGARLRTHFGVELALHDFFDLPTVANTARLLADASGTGAELSAPIERLAREEPAEPEPGNVDELSDDQVDALLREMLAAEASEGGVQS